MALPLPRFYDPAQVGTLYLERAAEVAAAAREYAAAHGVRPASEDRERVCLFGIDVQVTFCLPGASLFVPGAVEDCRRAVEWLYRNLPRVTGLVFTLDTHTAFQIFHPSWWVDARGEHPAPLTPVYAADVAAGRWRATREPEASLAYLEALERKGRYVHTVWPYHGLQGSVSNALVPAVHEAALFHAHARQAPVTFAPKGLHPLTENYSVFAPEVRELGGRVLGAFDQKLLDTLLAYDRVYVFGEAKSHCVRFSVHDMLERIRELDPSLARRLYLLEDAMSPVPAPPLDPLPAALDFPRLADEALEAFARAGVNIVKTGDAVG
jgi:nicotinamidase-related amidase